MSKEPPCACHAVDVNARTQRRADPEIIHLYLSRTGRIRGSRRGWAGPSHRIQNLMVLAVRQAGQRGHDSEPVHVVPASLTDALTCCCAVGRRLDRSDTASTVTARPSGGTTAPPSRTVTMRRIASGTLNG